MKSSIMRREEGVFGRALQVYKIAQSPPKPAMKHSSNSGNPTTDADAAVAAGYQALQLSTLEINQETARLLDEY